MYENISTYEDHLITSNCLTYFSLIYSIHGAKSHIHWWNIFVCHCGTIVSKLFMRKLKYNKMYISIDLSISSLLNDGTQKFRKFFHPIFEKYGQVLGYVQLYQKVLMLLGNPNLLLSCYTAWFSTSC